jgi:hypothetical protein
MEAAMLHNMTPAELKHLEAAPFDFFLTGSRFFGGAKEGSDWDFYTEASTSVEEFLINRGYTVSLTYEDLFTVRVVTRETPRVKIDIQLVQNADLKTRAQGMLAPYIKRVSKEYHRVLWDMAFEWLKSN